MYRYVLLLFPIFLWTCDPAQDDDTTAGNTFDRELMLAHWADDIVTPALNDFTFEYTELSAAAEVFEASPTAADLATLKDRFEAAYVSWQRFAPFAGVIGDEYRLVERLNTYPTDTERLENEAGANLELPSNDAIQGFPALDYLLYGTEDPASYRTQIREIVNSVALDSPRQAWLNGGRDRFVSNSGNSATASVDRTVNDLIFYYEKHLRAGKVGIPAGVFSNGPMPELAEAPYHGELSRQLFLAGLDAISDFFSSDPSLASYLDALSVEREGQLLSARIDAGFATAQAAAEGLDQDFAIQVSNNNTAMLQLYDALQANVILLKVDMLQALGINVDFVDADGD
ncbi:putative lipoprotein [Lewinella aquimaris]|uniref:Putative lipoprotein n=1 Tax=Neolewinella aquimaris TaxID=1835722 RepID=A0A840EBE1_9BACT|nr:imelysin family protein [Neolewinella aquimaris]MBB4078306.1 putative lipoprotein [Neolewinella aquimaris]